MSNTLKYSKYQLFAGLYDYYRSIGKYAHKELGISREKYDDFKELFKYDYAIWSKNQFKHEQRGTMSKKVRANRLKRFKEKAEQLNIELR